MNSAALYSALGATIVFAGSLIQFVREARGFSSAATKFDADHESLVKDSIKEQRKRLRWYQLLAKWSVPKDVKLEVRNSLPSDEVVILRDIDHFSWGWSFVAVGSLASAFSGWWQMAAG